MKKLQWLAVACMLMSNPVYAADAAIAEAGSLRAVMQQLGRDYAALDQV